MIVLGCDPGYKNFGVAVVDLGAMQVLHSETICLGDDRWRWGPTLWSALDRVIAARAVDFVALEQPQVVHDRWTRRTRSRSRRLSGEQTVSAASTLGLWGSALLLERWAFMSGIRMLPPVDPTAIKMDAAWRAGEAQKFDRRNQPKKGDMARFHEALFGSRAGNDHEADAALAALAASCSVEARSVRA